MSEIPHTEQSDVEPWEDEYAAELVAEMRAKLPRRIALCPEHAPEFYYPLQDDEGLMCPSCSLEMVVYVREDSRS